MKVQSLFTLAVDAARNSNYFSGTPVGAVLLNRDGDILSVGWNKFPEELDASFLNALPRKEKAACVVHAEMVALMQAIRHGVDLENGSVVVTRYPCMTCLATLIHAGVKSFHFLNRKPFENEYARYEGLIREVDFIEYDQSTFRAMKEWSKGWWEKSIQCVEAL